MDQKPGKLQAIVLMQLITGILGLITQIILILSTCGLWLVWIAPIYAIVTEIMAIVSGAKGLGRNDRHSMYKTVAIMQIVSIIGGDIYGLVSGILCLVFLNDPEVQAYLNGQSWQAGVPPTQPPPSWPNEP